ncbi:MAG: plasmid stabilization protein [Chloroflexota bacterium]|nr:plasmid stabilization protein [Chloroflexota bacterium]
MARGSKAKYTDKQKRQAEEIAEGYVRRGVSEKVAKARAWATVNKMYGGGKKSGSGRGKRVNLAPAIKGGRKGAAALAARPFYARSASARKAARTRARRAR